MTDNCLIKTIIKLETAKDYAIEAKLDHHFIADLDHLIATAEANIDEKQFSRNPKSRDTKNEQSDEDRCIKDLFEFVKEVRGPLYDHDMHDWEDRANDIVARCLKVSRF